MLADHIGNQYPAYTVRVHPYNAGTFKWDAPAIIQSGAAGDRKITFDGSTFAACTVDDSSLPSPTGDLDIRVKAVSSNWSRATTRTLVSKFEASGARSWSFYLHSGTLNFWYSVDGSTLVNKSVTQAGLVNDTATWLRVTMDVDNGASGNTVKFYRSSDKVTWTQIGLGATQGGASRMWNGGIYEVEVRSGIDGQIIAPTLPTLWTGTPSIYNAVTAGAPVLDIWNAAASGFGVTT